MSVIGKKKGFVISFWSSQRSGSFKEWRSRPVYAFSLSSYNPATFLRSQWLVAHQQLGMRRRGRRVTLTTRGVSGGRRKEVKYKKLKHILSLPSILPRTEVRSSFGRGNQRASLARRPSSSHPRQRNPTWKSMARFVAMSAQPTLSSECKGFKKKCGQAMSRWS